MRLLVRAGLASLRSPYSQYFGKTCPYSRMRLLAILSVNQFAPSAAILPIGTGAVYSRGVDA
ncbi:hypothetical protein K9N68_38270 (plasmid) [Kovacikia minuta CCNUW1]|uniref:hypothetical protein n=1 Tax=Kovacikia minuta TaxID=2931930 RepID=UPI001CCC1E11|nr:hypothetical protein [Kovacikia minuta]UBF30045.1 hypothetical protein K9N68_38270 [Kovacikia minuta CCNUW1]